MSNVKLECLKYRLSAYERRQNSAKTAAMRLAILVRDFENGIIDESEAEELSDLITDEYQERENAIQPKPDR